MREISDHLLLQSSFMSNLGLYRGKIGSVLFFFHYSKHTKNNLYEDFAMELIGEILENLTLDTPVNFIDGLCGIGWSINYLIHEKFVENDDNLLSEIDSKIMMYNPRRMNDISFDFGLEGIVCYVKSRMNVVRNKAIQIFENTYLDELKVTCRKLGLNYNDDSRYGFSTIMHKLLNSEQYRYEPLSWQAGLKKLL